MCRGIGLDLAGGDCYLRFFLLFCFDYVVGELFNEKMKFEMCLILKHGSSNRFSPSEYSREMCFEFVLTKDKAPLHLEYKNIR